MMFPSLLANYDALTRNHFVLAEGTEDEFRRFVHSVHKAYSQWFQTEKDIIKLRDDLRKCQQEKATLETELKHARSQIKFEFQKRSRVEHDRNSLEELIEMIKSLLSDKNKSMLDEKDMQKLAFLNSYQRSDVGKRNRATNKLRESSASCLSDISYDVTDDDLEVSASKDFQTESTPPKRKKTSHSGDTSIVTHTSVHLDPDSGKPHATTMTQINMPKLNKSFSEPMLDVQFKNADSEEEEVWTLRPGHTPRSRKRNSKSSHQRTQSESDSPYLRKANSASSGLNKIHVFISKTVIKPEYCQPCGAKIKFGKMAMRCKECKMICHAECRNQLPIPCIPLLTRTPGAGKDYTGIITDYAPVSPPFVPGIVVHLTAEIERRGLNEVGIYRIPGSERQVKDLKEKFWKGKSTPNLSLVDDINVVCACLKDFLRNLKESLITYKLWPEFVKIVTEYGRNKDKVQNSLCRVINQLPPANRDTLAFLIKHLQLVAQTTECRMPKENLAKVFGPTVVGFSHPEPEAKDILSETKLQSMVMEELLSLPIEFWISILQPENFPNENVPLTPDDRQVLHSMLGPVGITPTSSSSSKFSEMTPLSKFGLRSKNSNKRTKHFFDSPTLE